MFLRWIRRVVIVLCLACVGQAQQWADTAIPPESTELPSAFSRFSTVDVLKEIWSDYDPGTGRVAHLINDQKQPSLVRLRIAKRWLVGRKEFIVVMTEIASYDSQFHNVCTACRAVSPIAVLELANNKLRLVAKQEDEITEEEIGKGSDPFFDPFSYSGRESGIQFDLAPYRLNKREMMIGVRKDHSWIPAEMYSTELFLYRIEGNRIRQVFNEQVINRHFPEGVLKNPLLIEKSTMMLTMKTARRTFNDIVATKTTRRCSGNDETYDCNGGKLVKIEKIVWRFEGSTFTEVKN